MCADGFGGECRLSRRHGVLADGMIMRRGGSDGSFNVALLRVGSRVIICSLLEVYSSADNTSD